MKTKTLFAALTPRGYFHEKVVWKYGRIFYQFTPFKRLTKRVLYENKDFLLERLALFNLEAEIVTVKK